MSGKSFIMLTNQRLIKDLDSDVTSSQNFNIEESKRVLWTPFDTQDRIEQHYALQQSEAISRRNDIVPAEERIERLVRFEKT